MTAARNPGTPPGGRSVDALAASLRECAGNVTVAAQRLGMTRRELADRIAKSPRLLDVIDDEREKTIDMAETRLRNAIARPDEKINMDAIKFALTSPRAASRGWGKPSAAAATGDNGERAGGERRGMQADDTTPEARALAQMGIGPNGI